MQAATKNRSGAKDLVKIGLLGLFWATTLLLTLATPLEGQYFGRTKVQYDDIQVSLNGALHSLHPAGERLDRVAGAGEERRERVANRELVFDDEDGRHRCSSYPWFARANPSPTVT